MPENEPIRVWRFHAAPQELQDLSDHGGDEDWLALVPIAVESREPWIGWLEPGGPFGCSGVTIREHGDYLVYIGAHA